MIIFISPSNNIAIISSISDTYYTVSIFESFNAMKLSEMPIQEKKMLGKPNIKDLDKEFIGWNKQFRDDNTWQIVDSDPNIPDLPIPPQQVTARQIRLWLIQNGFQLSQIDSAIDSIEDTTTRAIVKVEWEYAPYVERSHPMLIPLAMSLGLTEEQVDQAFREAAWI
jgi:hypothetical protein